MIFVLQPMLASLEDAPLVDPALVYEPKYDGIRAVVEVGAGGNPVRLWSRLGNDKTSQFPEIAEALARWGRSRREPAGFQNLQGRIHLKEIRGGGASRPSRSASARAEAFASSGATSPKRLRR